LMDLSSVRVRAPTLERIIQWPSLGRRTDDGFFCESLIQKE